MKKCSNSRIIREIQINTEILSHLWYWPKLKTQQYILWKNRHSHTRLMGMQTAERSGQCLTERPMQVDPAITLPGSSSCGSRSNNVKIYMHKLIHRSNRNAHSWEIDWTNYGPSIKWTTSSSVEEWVRSLKNGYGVIFRINIKKNKK